MLESPSVQALSFRFVRGDQVAHLSQWTNINQKLAQETVWLHECRKVPSPLNQCDALDGRNYVSEEGLRQFRRGQHIAFTLKNEEWYFKMGTTFPRVVLGNLG